MDSRSLIQTVDWCICTGEGSNLSLNVLVLNYVCTFALVIFHFMKNKKSWFKKSLVESLFWQFNIYISHKTNKRSHFFVKWGNYFYQYNLGRLWHIEHIWSSLWGNTYLYFEFEVSFLSISLLFLPFLLFFSLFSLHAWKSCSPTVMCLGSHLKRAVNPNDRSPIDLCSLLHKASVALASPVRPAGILLWGSCS